MLGFKTFTHSSDFNFTELEVTEGTTRLYTVGDDKFPSMTSILKVLDDDNGWLERWAKRLPGGMEEAMKITKDASDRGNHLHDLSERYLLNTLKRDQTQGPACAMFNRAKRYLDRIEIVHAIEAPVYSKTLQYAGRLDCLETDDEGDFCILDHKNSRKAIDTKKAFGKKKLFKYMLQCCGYSLCIEEMFSIRPTHGTLIVSNYENMNVDRFKFPLKPLDKDFHNLVDAYYGRADVKENSYFKLKKG